MNKELVKLAFKLGYQEQMRKSAQTFSDDGSSFVLAPGQTPGHAITAWNRLHPDQRITVDQLSQANNGLDPTKYRAGVSYRLPAAAQPAQQPAPAPVQAPLQSPPQAQSAQPVQQPEEHWPIVNWFYKKSPTGEFARDVARSNVNRFARWTGLVDENDSLISGRDVTSMSNEQMDWLRQAILAKHKGKVPATGSFGGVRKSVGRNTDDYRTYVHPGFNYAAFPNTDNPNSWGIVNKYRAANWRNTGVPNQIEYTLGDWGWTTDKDGNVIVNDTYDFNSAEGHRQSGEYGGIRRWAGENASRDTDPDSGKTHFNINLGNPSTWGEFDPQRFHGYNEPYREQFPNDFIYSPR